MQRQFLHAPVQEFSNIQGVFTRAGNLVNPAELLRLLAGLADPRLSLALIAVHESPQRNWTLEDLADLAGMSRTRFAGRFHDVVGQTAIGYLAGWRMQVATSLLAKGIAIKTITSQVGYDDPTAFSRAFSKVMGCSPREWIKALEPSKSGKNE